MYLLMAFNTIIRASVGADLSLPSPIHRPSLDFYPDEKVNLHLCLLIGHRSGCFDICSLC